MYVLLGTVIASGFVLFGASKSMTFHDLFKFSMTKRSHYTVSKYTVFVSTE